MSECGADQDCFTVTYADGIEHQNGTEVVDGEVEFRVGHFVAFADGRASYHGDTENEGEADSSRWQTEYHCSDHLGNIRLIFADRNLDGYIQALEGEPSYNPGETLPEGYTEIQEEKHYYPFGMELDGPWRTPQGFFGDDFHGYNGKELVSDVGIDWMPYGARFYDAQLGRFTGVDPLVDKYHSFSGYNYVLNNPIRLIDPDGRDPGDFIIIFTGHQVSSDNQVTTAEMSKALRNNTTGRFIEYQSSTYFPNTFVDDAFNEVVDHKKLNPDSKISIAGYSLGGEFAMQLQQKLSDAGITVDGLYTIDGTPYDSEERTSEVGENVLLNDNYFESNQTGDLIKDLIFNLHGGANSSSEGSSTTVNNINMSSQTYKGIQINHYNIDGATMGEVVKSILTRTESGISQEEINQIVKQVNQRLNEVEKN